MSKYTIRYTQVSFLLSGISGISGYVWYDIILDIISYLVEVSKLLKFDESPGDLEGIHANI